MLPEACTAGGWDGVAGLPCVRGRQSGPGVEVTCLPICPVTAPWSLPGNRGLEHLRAGGQAVGMALTLYRVKGCLLHIPPNWETSYILFCFFFFFVATPRGLQDLSGGSVVKNSPANAGDAGLIPESGRSHEEGSGYSLQCSCLGQRSPAGCSP